MMSYHVILDVDGVMLQWEQSFVLHCNENYGSKMKLDNSGFKIEGQGTKLVDEVTPAMVNTFNLSESFSRLRPTPHAVETVAKMHKEGAVIDVLSSCLTEKNREITIENRKENLKNQFNGGHCFRDVTLISITTKKLYFFIDMIENSCYNSDKIFVLEDNVNNINEIARELPDSASYFLMDWGNGFLDGQPKPEDNVKVVRGWADFYRQIY